MSEVTPVVAGEGPEPGLDDVVEIDERIMEGFRADGHALVPGLASHQEAAWYRPLIEEVALGTAVDRRPLEERDTYGRAFLQSFNLWRVDPRIERFVRSARFAHVAAELLGVDGVRLYHDQALCKEAGGGRTPWHQDQYFWPVDTDRTVTMWMPLVDIPPEVGSLHFVTGSHRLGDLRGRGISDASDREFTDLIDGRRLPVHTYGAMKAGDATFHAGWTIHSAEANPSDALRTVMTVIYVADGAHVVRETANRAQEIDRQTWLAGADLGAPIDGPLNPLLWSRAAAGRP